MKRLLTSVLTLMCLVLRGATAQAQSPAFLTNGLVAYYPFNGNANDESGNGGHGTVAGANPNTDRFGNPSAAYQFNGGTYIDLPLDINLKPSAFSVWFKTERETTSSPSQVILLNHAFGVPGHGVSIDWNNNQIAVEYQNGYLNSGFSVTPGSWHQVTVAYGDKVRVFVDGVKLKEIAYATAPSFVSSITRLGRSQDLYVGAFDGAMDDVRFYNRALSDAEVAALYAYESASPIASGWNSNGLNVSDAREDVAISGDGSTVLLVGGAGNIYVSTNFTSSWRDTGRQAYGRKVGLSHDGATMLVHSHWGQLHVSHDRGLNWFTRGQSGPWQCAAVSANGTTMAAGNYYGGQMWVSGDRGETWNPRGTAGDWLDVVLSTNGQFMLSGRSAGPLQQSDDFGATWVPAGPSGNCSAVAMTPDGRTRFAGLRGGKVFRSEDFGSSWVELSVAGDWTDAACSTDGTIVLLSSGTSATNGFLARSVDSGGTWISEEQGQYWETVSLSADGRKALAAVYSGLVYTNNFVRPQDTPRQPAAEWTLVNSNGCQKLLINTNGDYYLAKQIGIDKSIDRGMSWTPTTYAPPVRDGFNALPGMAATPYGLFAGSLDQGVWRSTDGGSSWQNTFATGFGTGTSRMLYHQGILLMNYGGFLRGLYKWNQVTSAWDQKAGYSPDFLDLEVDDQGHFYATLSAGGDGQGGVFKSTDGGETWNKIHAAQFPETPNQIAWGAGRLVAVRNDRKVLVSTDRGVSWTVHDPLSGLLTADNYVTDLEMGADGRLYGAFHGYGILRSTDPTVAWENYSQGLPSTEMRSLSSDGENLFVATGAGLAMLRFSTGGVTAAPAITAQPQAVTANVGQTVSFTVGATNALTYQWTKDGNPLPGATNATLVLTNVQPVRIGDYRVVVGNGVGAVTSSVATLNLNGVDAGVWKGLVAYYPFNGNSNDESGNGNDGTVNGSVLTTNRFGSQAGAYWFNGTDSFIELTDIDLTESFTLTAWVAPEKYIVSILGKYQIGPEAYEMLINSSGYFYGHTRGHTEPGSTLVSASNPIGLNRWTAVTFVFDSAGSLGSLYANGTLLQSGFLTNSPDNDFNTRIGRSVWGGNGFLGGIDDVRIYNRALSADDVAALFAFESAPPVPTVVAAPANTTLVAGQTLTLTAQIVGHDVVYRWQKDESDLANGGRVSGADSQTLTVSGLTLADAGQYRLTATNANGSAVTAAATVTVHAPAAITAQPQSVDGIEGDAVALVVGFSGFPAPTFQWFKNDGAISGATGATLEFPALVETNAGSYRVVVSNVAGSVTSSNAVVTYTPAIRVLVNGAPVSGTVRTLNPVTVELRFAKPDWFLFYTLDGSEPDFTSAAYLSPFAITQPGDLRLIAYSADFSASVAGRPVAFRFLTPQTIAWGTLPALRFADSGPLTVSASSGLPVSVSVVNGPATLTGGVLAATGAGTVTLRAVQAGNDQFAPVSEERTLVIGPAVQTLTWPTLAAKTFGDVAFGVIVTAHSGLPVTLSVASGKATVSGTNVTLNGAGAVTLRAEQVGNTNYAAVTEERSFTVAKAAQTLTFPTIANRAYAPEPFTPVVVTGSGLPAVLEVLSGPATAGGSQLTLTGVGTVIVRATQPGNEDWEAALPSDRTFTVTPGTQTLAFTAVGAKIYGDGPVTLVATSSAGLPVSFRVLSGPGSVEGEVLTLNGAGSIVVQALQAGTERYQAASASQTIVVAKAAQGLNWATIPDQGYTTNAIPLTATATSGLPVSFRLVSGSATVSGAELRLTGIGAIAVAADQPGNTNWLAATSVTNTFTVSRGTQTLTFAPIGDQILGNPPVPLGATASSGLPVAFQVLSGPATVTGNQLTLLNEGSVTVRARQVGSPLWLAAQADQTIVIRRLTTLTLTVAGNLGGTVTVDPLKERYVPTESVTLTATAGTGFEFQGWSGDLSGTANPASLALSANRTVTATFRDVAPPVLTWVQPVAGTTGNERVSLGGTVGDNAGVTAATWSRDGAAAQALTVADGQFSVPNLVLHVGTNRFAVTLRDAAGNETVEERTVVWVPERVLQVADAPEVQEGQRVTFPVTLSSVGPDVAGLTFRLAYDPAYLADPQVEWGALVGQSVNNLNLGTAGEIGGSFALAGTALPAGTNPVARISFRARSVPLSLLAVLTPQIESLSNPSGGTLPTGNAAVGGAVRIKPRRLTGDNNANQRLDVGDAVVISRLQVGLEERRSWDVGLNDLNTSGALDSGDVVKVLRAVVGLDPQPTPSGGVARAGVARQANNTNDVVTLEFPDGPVAALGQSWRVLVNLVKSTQPPSGLSFTLRYPGGLTLGDKQVGALIPAGALPLWGEVPGGLTFAAVSPNAWPTSTGVAAVLTFTANAGLAALAEWPLTLAPVELTVNGFDIRALDDVAGVVRSASVPEEPPVVVLPPPGADGKLTLEVTAGAGQEVIVETTTDLNAWTEAQRVTGQGSGTPVRVIITPQANVDARFWRVRRP